MRTDRGFTLIELLVTITVAAMLLGVGVPSMAQLLKTNRRTAAVNALVADIQQARSIAASRGMSVTLCHSSSGSACTGEEDPDWAEGWMLFVDDDQDGVPEESTDGNAAFDAGETLLGARGMRGGVRMPSNRTAFRFRPGFASSTAGTVGVCIEGDNNDRWISTSIVGRPSLATEDDDVAC